MSNTDNDTPKPAESGPLDLAEIEARRRRVYRISSDMTDELYDDLMSVIEEGKRLRGEVNKLSKSIHDWDNDERGYEIKRFNPPYPEEEK
jgi:hypothetical protein